MNALSRHRYRVASNLLLRSSSRRHYAIDHPGPRAQVKNIFSGIQPTGIPHLGNYLGAIAQWKTLQDACVPDDRIYFSIVDLHSLTSLSANAAERKNARRETLAVLLAAGIDPQRCVVFNQSAVPQHVELHWILSCYASVGALARISTWKDKFAEQRSASANVGDNANEDDPLSAGPAKDNQEGLKLGLLSYPVLQAADILLYNATYVPVGEDQRQHIELARNLADTFNHTHGKRFFWRPDAVYTSASRIMSLQEPERKMSKSAPSEKSRILLTDSDETIHSKLRSAVTDSQSDITYDREARPGLANLINIVATLETRQNKDKRTPQDVAGEYDAMVGEKPAGSVMRLLKDHAADLVCTELGPVRERFLEIRIQKQILEDIAEQGAVKARSRAELCMKAVRRTIGL